MDQKIPPVVMKIPFLDIEIDMKYIRENTGHYIFKDTPGNEDIYKFLKFESMYKRLEGLLDDLSKKKLYTLGIKAFREKYRAIISNFLNNNLETTELGKKFLELEKEEELLKLTPKKIIAKIAGVENPANLKINDLRETVIKLINEETFDRPIVGFDLSFTITRTEFDGKKYVPEDISTLDDISEITEKIKEKLAQLENYPFFPDIETINKRYCWIFLISLVIFIGSLLDALNILESHDKVIFTTVAFALTFLSLWLTYRNDLYSSAKYIPNFFIVYFLKKISCSESLTKFMENFCTFLLQFFGYPNRKTNKESDLNEIVVENDIKIRVN